MQSVSFGAPTHHQFFILICLVGMCDPLNEYLQNCMTATMVNLL